LKPPARCSKAKRCRIRHNISVIAANSAGDSSKSPKCASWNYERMPGRDGKRICKRHRQLVSAE
jgi:hypothetical protein